jgi:hypothetical protein
LTKNFVNSKEYKDAERQIQVSKAMWGCHVTFVFHINRVHIPL